MLNIKRSNLTEGALFSKMLIFVFPIILTGILQLLYNSANQIVVGKFSGDPNALGAIGCTASTVNLVISMLTGFAAGTSVIISQLYGAKNGGELSKAVHTVLAAGFIGGAGLLSIGELVAPAMLKLLGTKPDLFAASLLYIRIIFLGVPGLAIFNLGAAIVRSVGDSKTPMIILIVSGVLHVSLNLIFVIVFDMSIAGVAVATIISQYVSAAAIIIKLKRTQGTHRFKFKSLSIDGALLRKILRISVPSAIQTSLFAISTLLMQSSINTFTTDEVSGSAVAVTIESFIYMTVNSFYTVALTFTGQNYGAKKLSRVKKTAFYSMIQVAIAGLILGMLITVFAERISLIYLDPEAENVRAVVSASCTRLRTVMPLYFIYGLTEVLTGFLRGCGYSLMPMLSSVFCICFIRAAWVKLIFPLPLFNSPVGLYIVYPISWILALLFLVPMSCIIYKKTKKTMQAGDPLLQKEDII